jgi:hypothetical protein
MILLIGVCWGAISDLRRFRGLEAGARRRGRDLRRCRAVLGSLRAVTLAGSMAGGGEAERDMAEGAGVENWLSINLDLFVSSLSPLQVSSGRDLLSRINGQ